MQSQEITSLAYMLKGDLLKALRAWRSTSHRAMLDNLLLVQTQRRRMQADTALYRLATNTVILEALDELQRRDERSATILRERFLDDQTVQFVALQQHMTVDAFKKVQRKAIVQLAYVIAEQEIVLRREIVNKQSQKIEPPTYTKLYGFDAIQTEICAYLSDNQAPLQQVVIVGIGGIGKTALADAVVRQLIADLRFVDVGWVEARQSPLAGKPVSPNKLWEQIHSDLCRQFPTVAAQESAEALHSYLKNNQTLIVIDNVEHKEEIETIVAQLRPMLTPSRALITSRARPQASAFTYPIDELGPADTLALLRHEARAHPTPRAQLATADDNTLLQIYSATGGNPLALKLVVGLCDTLSLPDILSDLSKATIGETEAMYRRIFLRAWDTLSVDARTLLKMMPLVTVTGATAQQIQSVTKLSDQRLWVSITELTDRSLLQIKGSLQTKRYTIHRLTEQFLRTEIIHWQA
jgi:hypothetical protein